MDHDVYMEQPEGCAEGNPKDFVCLLKKSLYGAKYDGKSLESQDAHCS